MIFSCPGFFQCEGQGYEHAVVLAVVLVIAAVHISVHLMDLNIIEPHVGLVLSCLVCKVRPRSHAWKIGAKEHNMKDGVVVIGGDTMWSYVHIDILYTIFLSCDNEIGVWQNNHSGLCGSSAMTLLWLLCISARILPAAMGRHVRLTAFGSILNPRVIEFDEQLHNQFAAS